MLVLDTPLQLSVLQLLAVLPIGLWGCLQCDEKFKENVAKLRTDLVQRQIRDSRLKARAEALLQGLEGDFFSHYATSQFAGFAGTTWWLCRFTEASTQSLNWALNALLLSRYYSVN